MLPSPSSKQNKQKQHSLCSVHSTAMTPKRVNIIITFFFKGISLLSWRFAMGPPYKRASLVAELQRICLQCRRHQFSCWVRKIPWRRDRLSTSAFLGSPGGSNSKEFEEGMATHSSILAWRIPMGRGAWRAIVHEVKKGRTRLST